MLIGHKKQIKFLEDSLAAGKISQAYFFAGPESVGKFFIAKLFALAIANGEVKFLTDDLEGGENKIQDINILAPLVIEKKDVIKVKDIDVDSVREAQKNLALFPAVGKKRILIINDAHRLTVASQNALLKTLEEPNSSSVIILVTHQEGRILKTVRSRCQKINFNLVSLEEIKKGFSDLMAPSLLEKATIFSMGKPGGIKKMIEDSGEFTQKEEIVRELEGLRSMAIYQKFDLAQEYAKDLKETRKKMEFWVWMLRIQAFRNLTDFNRLENSYLSIGKIEEASRKMKNNSLNGRLILENLFLDL